MEKKTTCLNNIEMELDYVDRINDKKGGSIALIHKDNMRSKLTEKGNLRTFKYGLCNIMNGNNNFDIFRLYHPPPSNKNHHMNHQFIDKFLQLHSWLSEKHFNIIITGDFNIHYFKEVNNAEQPKDMMKAMGLVQFVNFPTYLSANCLDLVFTEQIGRIKISNNREDMLSDYKTTVWDILLEIF